MRLNKYIAQATGLSRRAADEAIYRNRVLVNGSAPTPGQQISDTDSVTLDSQPITPSVNSITIMLNKPIGYVCSREGQGSRTVYDLLPSELHVLKPVGRLDKDSEGLLLMTTDGQMAQELTHPKYEKTKQYQIWLSSALQPLHRQMISEYGLRLDDGPSKLTLQRVDDADDSVWTVVMHEGRNRQIRRTFESLGYTVNRLQRLRFGTYHLGDLKSGSYITL